MSKEITRLLLNDNIITAMLRLRGNEAIFVSDGNMHYNAHREGDHIILQVEENAKRDS